MDDEFETETQRLMEEALKEREDDSSDKYDEDNEAEESENGDEDSESESDESTENKDEDNDGDSGDRHENEYADGEKEKSKLEFEPIEVEVAGHKVTINSKEEMLAYIKKGASAYETKPESHTEEKLIIDQGKLSAEDLKLLVDARNGSKEALAKIAKISNIDILDVDNKMADDYKQQQEYYRQSEVDVVADEILKDADHSNDFRKIVSALPQDFVSEVTSNAKDLKAFSNHIKSGIAQKVIPLAINSQIVNGGTFLENYNKVGQAMSQQKEPEQKREVGQREADLRKRASSGTGHNHQSDKSSGKDVWDMSDEEFDKLSSSDLSKLK